MRSRSTLAAVLALSTALAACGGSAATPAPTASPTATAVAATPSLTPTAAPSATDTATTAPSDSAAPGDSGIPTDLIPATASDPKVSGKGVILNLPADWLVVTLPDVATEATLATWFAAHPAADQATVRSMVKTMTDNDVALVALDPANAGSGFTPNLNITFADAPTGDMTAFLADQAKQIHDSYGLDATFEYTSFSPAGGMAGFLGDYTWTSQDVPLAVLQLILPMDSRLAVLTFTALANQTSHYGTVLQPIFSAVKQQ
jgi:hypothetical protein